MIAEGDPKVLLAESKTSRCGSFSHGERSIMSRQASPAVIGGFVVGAFVLAVAAILVSLGKIFCQH